MTVAGLKQLKYNQARMAILNMIAENDFVIGDKLPPERQLVERLNCSSITMRHALASLENEGIIEKRHGLGNYLTKDLRDDVFAGKILFISVIQQDEDSPGLGVDRIRRYLSGRGIGLAYVAVSDCGREVVEAARGCIGIILQGWLTDEFVDKVKMLKLPMIISGNNELKTDVPRVSLDLVDISYRLTREFISKGLTRIAILGGVEEYSAANEHVRGYIKAMREAGLPYQDYIAPTAGRFAIYSQIDSFMRKHYGEVEALLMEYAGLDIFVSWCWENNYPGKPKIGIYQVLGDYRGYHVTQSLYWGHFENSGRIAAQLLLDSISSDKPVQSRVLKAVIHGVDDNLTDFIS